MFDHINRFFNRDYKARKAALELALAYAQLRKPEGSVLEGAGNVAAVAGVFHAFLAV